MDYDLNALTDAPVADWGRGTPYDHWRERQKIPVHRAFYIDDLRTLATEVWDQLGTRAAFVELDGAGDNTAAYVINLDQDETTQWRRHTWEEIVYVAAGRGVSEVQSGRGVSVARWGPGAVFPLPLNQRYRHTAVEAGTVLYCVNNAPPIMNLFHHDGFLFDNPFEFDDRFDQSESYYSGDGRFWRHGATGSVIWETNFVEDAVNIALPDLARRGAKGRNVMFQFSGHTLRPHISEFPVGTYKKAHRHGPGAQIVLLAGVGYSLLWRDNFAERVKVDWKPNSVFVPPNLWWHQHFNSGTEPARYLAIHMGGKKFRFDHSYERDGEDRRSGGDQIEYDDQDLRVHDLFASECAAHGVQIDESAVR
ncbi:MAG: hypothetical protein ACRDWW_03145 [Acidimicrobiales bacterium]